MWVTQCPIFSVNNFIDHSALLRRTSSICIYLQDGKGLKVILGCRHLSPSNKYLQTKLSKIIRVSILEPIQDELDKMSPFCSWPFIIENRMSLCCIPHLQANLGYALHCIGPPHHFIFQTFQIKCTDTRQCLELL